jgi:hypothetical protein
LFPLAGFCPILSLSVTIIGMKNIRIIIAAVLVTAGLLINSQIVQAADVNWANIRIGKVQPGAGHIGVDMWWPSSGGAYVPCHHSNDPYYGSCVLSNAGQTSYYKVGNYNTSTSNFPYGIFIDNQNTNYCTSSGWCPNPGATSHNHGWGRLSSDASLEIYPYNNSSQYDPSSPTSAGGGLRIQVTGFPVVANGGKYSADIGTVTLPQMGQPNVGRLNGFVRTNSGLITNNERVVLELFQHDYSMTTSTGYPAKGFVIEKNNTDGYYTTGPIPVGEYRIYATDTQTSRKIYLDFVRITSQHARIDFNTSQTCFGHPGQHCVDPAT